MRLCLLNMPPPPCWRRSRQASVHLRAPSRSELTASKERRIALVRSLGRGYSSLQISPIALGMQRYMMRRVSGRAICLLHGQEEKKENGIRCHSHLQGSVSQRRHSIPMSSELGTQPLTVEDMTTQTIGAPEDWTPRCVHMHVRMHTCVHVCLCVCECMCMCMCTCVCMCAHAHTFRHISVHVVAHGTKHLPPLPSMLVLRQGLLLV